MHADAEERAESPSRGAAPSRASLSASPDRTLKTEGPRRSSHRSGPPHSTDDVLRNSTRTATRIGASFLCGQPACSAATRAVRICPVLARMISSLRSGPNHLCATMNSVRPSSPPSMQDTRGLGGGVAAQAARRAAGDADTHGDRTGGRRRILRVEPG
jgi:hypothetical protein